MPSRLKDAMSISLYEHYERLSVMTALFMYIMNLSRKNSRCQDCFDWL
jgi:hypothetical protein